MHAIATEHKLLATSKQVVRSGSWPNLVQYSLR